jgi:hypothetical protein
MNPLFLIPIIPVAIFAYVMLAVTADRILSVSALRCRHQRHPDQYGVQYPHCQCREDYLPGYAIAAATWPISMPALFVATGAFPALVFLWKTAYRSGNGIADKLNKGGDKVLQ